MYKKFNNKNLIELKDLMFSPFYICLTKKYREFLIKKALDKKKDFKNLAKKIECNHYTLRHFRDYDKKYIKAKFLENLLNLLDISIKDVEKYVLSIKRGCSNRTVEINLPIKSTPELALLMAKVCGDGSVLSDWRFHYTNNQLNLIEEVINAVEISIGKTRYYLHERINRNIYEIKFSPVIGFILNLIGAPKSYKINQEFKIPDWIINGNKEIKLSFLRGIFDDESTVDHRTVRTKRIILAMGKIQKYESSLRNFLKQIQKLLFEFNISTGNINVQEKYSDKIILRFAIYQKSNFENFKKFIDFTHVNKKNILRNIINSYIDVHKTKKEILETLRNSTIPLTIKEIAGLNGLKSKTAAAHLYNLFRENTIKRIDGKPARWFVN